MAVLIVTNVRGYSPSLPVRSSVKVKAWVRACDGCVADELSLISPVHWSIHHRRTPLKILTAPRVRPLFNLRSCCFKPPTDLISGLDTLFLICITRLLPCKDSLLRRLFFQDQPARCHDDFRSLSALFSWSLHIL